MHRVRNFSLIQRRGFGNENITALTLDTPFKRAFHDKENIKNLLNALFEDSKDVKIKNVVSINESSRLGTKAARERSVIYDLHCTLDDNSEVIVELQKANQRSFIYERLVGYLSRDYSFQWMKGGKGYKLTPVRVVAILDFTLHADPAKSGTFIQRFVLSPYPGTIATQESEKQLAELVNITTVQLPLAPDVVSACTTSAQKWAVLIRDSQNFSRHTIPDEFSVAPFKAVVNVACVASFNPQQLARYQEELEKAKIDAAMEQQTIEVQRERDEAQRERDEAQRKSDEAQRKSEEIQRECDEAQRERDVARALVKTLEDALKASSK